ncbi:hypothetical protein [Vibrio campbellii]|uniref:hypothetical protein n=1 Tax=Vibrio campbellii TaxID=680 RepID=UPI00039DD1E9|nr:hypothetical protein [Vibrio campbellii]NIY86936.1 hypothetical protein [Vibrio campbellii]NVK70201.1 hypothetical protein [Vibrio campbellii]
MSNLKTKLRQIIRKTRDEWAIFAVKEMGISSETVAKSYGYRSSCDLEQTLKQGEKDATSYISSESCARSLTSDVSKTTVFD